MATHPLWRPYSQRANADRQGQRVAYRQTQPGPLHEHREEWAAQYRDLRKLILTAIPDQVLSITHIGSTAIPGLIAKPVLDIDVTVPDVDDEVSYLPGLEVAGFRLTFRDDLGGDPHRQLTFADPNANLHVWNPGAVEPQRHQVFVRWLLANPGDSERYANAKLAGTGTNRAHRYNDLKAAVVYDIFERALLADPSYDHDPHPRASPNGPAPR